MSLILEALRKSEAERRRGQVPDLHAERPPAAQLARDGRPAWLGLLALAIVAVIATAWLMRDLWAPTPRTAGVSSDQLPDRDRSSPPDSAVAARQDDPTDARRPAAPARVGSVTPSTIEPPAEAASISEVTPPPALSEAAPVASAPDPQRDTEPATPAGDTVNPTASAASPAPPIATPSPRPAKPPAASTIPTAPDPTAPAAVGDAAPLHLSELAASERRGLPPLQVSMHMWAPTSAGRFAIIDGARVNEGDRLGDAVVEEITRDGVVLAWRGRRVQIPIH